MTGETHAEAPMSRHRGRFPPVIAAGAFVAVAWVIWYAASIAKAIPAVEPPGAEGQPPLAFVIGGWLRYLLGHARLTELAHDLVWWIGVVGLARGAIDRASFLRALSVSALVSGVAFWVETTIGGLSTTGEGGGGYVLVLATMGALWGSGAGERPLFGRRHALLLVAFLAVLVVDSVLQRRQGAAGAATGNPVLGFLLAGGPVLLFGVLGESLLAVTLAGLGYALTVWALARQGLVPGLELGVGDASFAAVVARAAAVAAGVLYGRVDRAIRRRAGSSSQPDLPMGAPPVGARANGGRRVRRRLALLLATGVVALVAGAKHRAGLHRLDAGEGPGAAAARGATTYDLAQLTILSKVLFHARESHVDKNRLDSRRMLLGALDFLQRDVPEVVIDPRPEGEPKEVTVKVNGRERAFPIGRVDGLWAVRATLQEICGFVQANLPPVPDKEVARRLVGIESAVTNGMLDALDPRSVLLDVATYRDMRTQTRGKSGGLGIVLEMDKKNRITVKRPMPDAPAFRVGIKAKDRIVRIDNESTINMTLDEVVERLRGDVDTAVEVYIDRDGSPGTKKFTVTRAFVRPPAIDPPPRVLSVPAAAGAGRGPVAKIGYFHLQHFSANSAGDLRDALALFERAGVRGIIMDLRGNPGGLYEQAAKVADAFIKTGTLVSMVGAGGGERKDEIATDSGREPTVPVAVLVDRTSASASEIVAGALKNLDRGVVIGERTFGVGSVQVLFDIQSPVALGDRDGDDKLGLKLTTARFLTPGDVSTQEVGVTPDIGVLRMTVPSAGAPSRIRLQPSRRGRSRTDQPWRSQSAAATSPQQPPEIVSYLSAPRAGTGGSRGGEEDEDDPSGEEDEEPAGEEIGRADDFEIELARDLLAQATSARRGEVLRGAKGFLERVRRSEEQKVVQALGRLGVDWSGRPGGAPAELRLTLQAEKPDARAAAGDTVKIRGVVKNIGTAIAFRVRALLESDNPLFDEREMVFGTIAAGESKRHDLSIKVPASSFTRTDVVRGTVFSQRGGQAGAAEMTLDIDGKARPLFACAYQTIDDVAGNQDGQVQRGERVRTVVMVKNIGLGPAPHIEATLRTGPGQKGLLISAGRFEAKDLAPGETRTFSFVYEVGREIEGDEYQLAVVVRDTVLAETVTDKIKVKLVAAGQAPAAATGTVTAGRSGVPLRQAPAEGAMVVGRAPEGAAFRVTGKAGAFARVEIDGGRPAFVAAADTRMGGGAVRPSFEPEWQVRPPVLTVTAPTATKSETVRLKGSAIDDRLVRDVYVRRWNRDARIPMRKVFHQPNRPSGDRTRLDFETDVPLLPGSNVIEVFARGSTGVESKRTLVVLRGHPTNGSTP